MFFHEESVTLIFKPGMKNKRLLNLALQYLRILFNLQYYLRILMQKFSKCYLTEFGDRQQG
jgi:hypothetical protein